MRQTQCTLSTNSCKRALTMIDEPLRDYRDSTFSKGLRLTWRRPTELTWPCIRARKIQVRLRDRGFAGLARAARHAASAPRARRFPSRPPPRSSASASIPRLVQVCRVGISRQETSSFPNARCEADRISTKTSNNGGKIYEQNNRSNHATHGAASESHDKSKQQGGEVGKGNHGTKAALHLVRIQVRAHHAPLSFQYPSRLQWNGSRRQKRTSPDDASATGRDKGVDPYRRTRCGRRNARCRSIGAIAL